MSMMLMFPTQSGTNFTGYEGISYVIGPGCVDVEPADVALALRNGWVQVPQPPDGTMMQRTPDAKSVLRSATDESDKSVPVAPIVPRGTVPQAK
jgi:hypothetical protein